MLRQRVDGIARPWPEPGERRGRDDGAAGVHHVGQTAHAEDDAVDVDADDAPVVGNGLVRARHAGVQARELDRADVGPRVGIGDVEAVHHVEHLHVSAFGAEQRDGRSADARSAAGDQCRARKPAQGAGTDCFANCSRSAVLRNLPTAVFGISSTNSNRSGSHHFANVPARYSRSSSGVAVCPRLEHDHGQRPLRPLLVRDRDHRRLGDRRVPHQRVLELDGRDPLAARLDHVLRAVLDLMKPRGCDRDDVAGLEPAVVRPAVGLLGRRRSTTPPPRGRAPRARPSTRRPTGSRSRRRRGRGSRQTGAGSPAARRSRTASPRRRRADRREDRWSTRRARSRSSPSRGRR